MENNLKKYITVLLDAHLKLTQYYKSINCISIDKKRT